MEQTLPRSGQFLGIEEVPAQHYSRSRPGFPESADKRTLRNRAECGTRIVIDRWERTRP